MMSAPRIGSLFSGYGGLDLGVIAALGGGDVMWHVEFDENPSRILDHQFPGVPNYGDISAVDFAAVEPVDVLTGGFPCQDVSLAGSRKGLKDGTRSGLWTQFARAIDELRPSLVVIENVRGLLSADGEPWHDELLVASDAVDLVRRLIAMAESHIHGNPTRSKEGRSAHVDKWRRARVRLSRSLKRAVARFDRERRLVRRAIDTVLRDLADLGFDAEWCGIRAADAGAPHGRFRVFILAWPTDTSSQRRREGWAEPARIVGRLDASVRGGASPDTEAVGRGFRSPSHERPATREVDASGDTFALHLADTDGAGLGGVGWIDRAQRDADRRRGARQEAADAERVERAGKSEAVGREPAASRGDGGAAPDTRGVGDGGRSAQSRTEGSDDAPERSGERGASADAGSARLGEHTGESPAQEAREAEGDEPAGARRSRPAVDWGPYRAAVERWERVTGRVAPAPTRADGRDGQHRLNPEFVEWMMGLPAGWVTEPAIWVGMSDSAARNAQLRALGNGVVWQQAALAMQILLVRKRDVRLAA